jgi:hypothetical protein
MHQGAEAGNGLIAGDTTVQNGKGCEQPWWPHIAAWAGDHAAQHAACTTRHSMPLATAACKHCATKPATITPGHCTAVLALLLRHAPGNTRQNTEHAISWHH